MAQPIVLLFQARMKETWLQLSEEEQDEIMAKLGEAFDSVGGKRLLMADCEWSSGRWQFFGVEEFPDLEALQTYIASQREIGFSQHVEEIDVLGTRTYPPDAPADN